MGLFHSASIFCCYICTCICCLKLHQVGEVFFKLNLVGATQLQCIYYLCRILISRPPRVFRHFKRRSCLYTDQGWTENDLPLNEIDVSILAVSVPLLLLLFVCLAFHQWLYSPHGCPPWFVNCLVVKLVCHLFFFLLTLLPEKKTRMIWLGWWGGSGAFLDRDLICFTSYHSVK